MIGRVACGVRLAAAAAGVRHLAVLAERAGAGRLGLTLFDGAIGADWSWSRRDEAMAASILAGGAGAARTLVVAGNTHTPHSRTGLGVPMGACRT